MKQFTASRLAGGNRLFPAEIHVDNFGVNLKIPGLFSGQQKSLGYDKISSINIDSPLIGFSKITFHTVGWGWDNIVAEGFEKADAEEIKQLVQLGIQSVRQGHSNNSGGNSATDISHIIAQSEATKAQADLEKRKLDLEEAKQRQEAEEKDAAKRKEKADEYRRRGKAKQAFLVENQKSVIIAGVVLIFAIFFAVIKFSESTAAALDAKLTKTSEEVEDLIRAGKYDEANNLVNELQDESTEQSPYSKNLFGNYTYTEYWKVKRDGYKVVIDSLKKSSTAQLQQPQQVANNQPAQQIPSQADTIQRPTHQQEAIQQPQPSNTNIASVVVDKAYFYDAPDVSKKRKGYLLKGEKITITSENGEFSNCTYTAANGSHTDAWMLKSDIKMD